MPGMFGHRIRSYTHVCGIGPRQRLEHLGCASEQMPPAKRLCFSEICKDKSQQVDMKETRRAVYTSISLSVSSLGSSLGVQQRSRWVSMMNPRMDEEHQDTGRKRDVSPRISMTSRDKRNKTRTAA